MALNELLTDAHHAIAYVHPSCQRSIASASSRTRSRASTDADVAHRALLVADIKCYLDDPNKVSTVVIAAAPAPPGAPIGDTPNDWLAAPPWFCGAVCEKGIADAARHRGRADV